MLYIAFLKAYLIIAVVRKKWTENDIDFVQHVEKGQKTSSLPALHG